MNFKRTSYVITAFYITITTLTRDYLGFFCLFSCFRAQLVLSLFFAVVLWGFSSLLYFKLVFLHGLKHDHMKVEMDFVTVDNTSVTLYFSPQQH